MSDPVEMARDFGVILRALVEPLALAAKQIEYGLYVKVKTHEDDAETSQAWCEFDTTRGDIENLARAVGARLPESDPDAAPKALFEHTFPIQEGEHRVNHQQALVALFKLIDRSKS